MNFLGFITWGTEALLSDHNIVGLTESDVDVKYFLIFLYFIFNVDIKILVFNVYL